MNPVFDLFRQLQRNGTAFAAAAETPRIPEREERKQQQKRDQYDFDSKPHRLMAGKKFQNMKQPEPQSDIRAETSQTVNAPHRQQSTAPDTGERQQAHKKDQRGKYAGVEAIQQPRRQDRADRKGFGAPVEPFPVR